MKKVISYLIVFIVAMVIGITCVNAEYDMSNTFDPAGIPYDTYVIGTHMFNREKNENYSGYLNTRAVMLAARTIDSDDIDSMIVYYKTIDGEWIDAITCEAVDEPDLFRIDYLNTELKLYKPRLGIYEDWYTKPETITSPTPYLILSIMYDKAAGMEVYYSEDNNEYTYLKTIDSSEYESLSIIGYLYYYVSNSLQVPKGKTYYFKFRFYNDTGDKTIYSNFTDPCEVRNVDIEIDSETIGYTADNKAVKEFTIDTIGEYDGVDFYLEESNTLLKNLTRDELISGKRFAFILDENDYIEVYAKAYYLVNGEKQYVGRSNTEYLYYSGGDMNFIATSSLYSESASDTSYKYLVTVNRFQNTYSDVTGLKMYCKTEDEGNYNYYATLDGTSIVVSVPTGKEYVCGFTVYNNEKESNLSVTVTLTGEYKNFKASGYSYTIDGKDGIYTYLSIDNESEITGYEVYKSSYITGPYELIDEHPSSITNITYTDYSRKYYKLRAYVEGPDGRIYSNFSEVINNNINNFINKYNGISIVNNVTKYSYVIGFDALDDYSGIKYVIDGNVTEEAVSRKIINLDKGNHSIKYIPYIQTENGKEYFELSYFNFEIDVDDNQDELNYVVEYVETKDGYSKFKVEFYNEDSYYNYLKASDIEIYSSDKYDSGFELLTTLRYSEMTASEKTNLENGYCYFYVPYGETIYGKARLVNYVSAEELLYSSEYGPTVKIVTSPPFMKNEYFEKSSLSDNQNTTFSIGLNSIVEENGEYEGDNSIYAYDGIELYGSMTEDGEYKKLSTKRTGYYGYDVTLLNENVMKYYKVRTFVKNGNEKIYSDFSEVWEYVEKEELS